VEGNTSNLRATDRGSGGAFLTGMSIANDDRCLCAPDTYGEYLFDGATVQSWINALTACPPAFVRIARL